MAACCMGSSKAPVQLAVQGEDRLDRRPEAAGDVGKQLVPLGLVGHAHKEEPIRPGADHLIGVVDPRAVAPVVVAVERPDPQPVHVRGETPHDLRKNMRS
eukprot:756896-Hanusia_phi.AAC.1